MARTRFSSTLSALILLALAVIWLIYLCAGNALGEDTTYILSIVISVIAIISLFTVFHSMKDISVPLFILIIGLILLYIPILLNLVSCILELCGINLFEHVPIFASILDVIYKILFIFIYIGLICNAWGSTESLIFRLIYLAIGLFLVFCAVLPWIPALAQNFDIPLIGF